MLNASVSRRNWGGGIGFKIMAQKKFQKFCEDTFRKNMHKGQQRPKSCLHKQKQLKERIDQGATHADKSRQAIKTIQGCWSGRYREMIGAINIGIQSSSSVDALHILTRLARIENKLCRRRRNKTSIEIQSRRRALEGRTGQFVQGHFNSLTLDKRRKGNAEKMRKNKNLMGKNSDQNFRKK